MNQNIWVTRWKISECGRSSTRTSLDTEVKFRYSCTVLSISHHHLSPVNPRKNVLCISWVLRLIKVLVWNSCCAVYNIELKSTTIYQVFYIDADDVNVNMNALFCRTARSREDSWGLFICNRQRCCCVQYQWTNVDNISETSPFKISSNGRYALILRPMYKQNWTERKMLCIFTYFISVYHLEPITNRLCILYQWLIKPIN